MNKNIIVVDDFYPNPNAIRKHALSVEYQSKDSKNNWPGRDSLDAYIDPETVIIISDIVGTTLTTHDSNKCSYYRITGENQKGTQHIHFDPNPGLIWAGVVYLTPTEKINSGTKFWRHKKYGWEKSPTLEEGEKHGISDHSSMLNFFETDGIDESKWEEILNIPFKYNRLVLFRPWLFHSGGIPFGQSDEDSRLVQLFFFHKLIYEG